MCLQTVTLQCIKRNTPCVRQLQSHRSRDKRFAFAAPSKSSLQPKQPPTQLVQMSRYVWQRVRDDCLEYWRSYSDCRLTYSIAFPFQNSLCQFWLLFIAHIHMSTVTSTQSNRKVRTINPLSQQHASKCFRCEWYSNQTFPHYCFLKHSQCSCFSPACRTYQGPKLVNI